MRMTPLNFLPLAAVAMVVGSTSAWYLTPDLGPAPAAPVASPDQPAKAEDETSEADDDPLGWMQPDVIESFAAPRPDAPSPFVRIPWASPRDFCLALGNLGLANPTFEGGATPTSGWSCVTDLLKPSGREESVASSLFVTARGDDPERIGQLRIKLNLVDPGTSSPVKAIGKDLLGRMYSALGWTPPAAALAALDGPDPGRFDDYGVTFDLNKEFGAAPRYNLIVTFPQKLGVGGEDSFTTGRRRRRLPPPGSMGPDAVPVPGPAGPEVGAPLGPPGPSAGNP